MLKKRASRLASFSVSHLAMHREEGTRLVYPITRNRKGPLLEEAVDESLCDEDGLPGTLGSADETGVLGP